MTNHAFFLVAFLLLTAGFSLLSTVFGVDPHPELALGPLGIASTMAILRAIERK